MSIGSDEAVDPAQGITMSLVEFTGKIGEALEDLCSYGLTIGAQYVPFDPDPEDNCDADEAACSQAWVRVESVVPTSTVDGWDDDCSTVLEITLEVGILRCFGIEEDGEAPTASDVLWAAAQSMTDMKVIYDAAMSSGAWSKINSGAWSPEGPLGGQYGGTWTFVVEV